MGAMGTVESEVVSGCAPGSPFSLHGHQAAGCHQSLEPKKVTPTTSFRNTSRGLELPRQSTQQGARSQDGTDLPVQGRGLFW